jgi:hypothetical protein
MFEAAMDDLTRHLKPRFNAAQLVEIGWFILDDDDEAFISSWESDGRIEAPYELTPSEVISIVIGF